MKKFICLALAVAMLIGMTACGGISQEEYDKVVAERDALISDYDALEKEHSELQEKSKESNALILAKDVLHSFDEKFTCIEMISPSSKILYVPFDESIIGENTDVATQASVELAKLVTNSEFDFDCIIFEFLHPLSDIPVTSIVVDCHTTKTYEHSWR